MSNYRTSAAILKRAKALIPSAAQTYSKSYRYYCEGAAPAFLAKGKGARVWDVDGNEFVDLVLGLGAITIGYGVDEVDAAIKDQLKNGISFSLATELEVRLAEEIVEIVPCAEKVRFLKNGSDATSAAIRLARAFTGRETVLACGYHGWHDWYIGSTPNDLGVPTEVKKAIIAFPYNNLEALEKLMMEKEPAAVIMEAGQLDAPKAGYLESVMGFTKKYGALLIFDEVITGFRLALGGAQEHFNVIPDLAAIGKGMANGAAVSAVVGRADVMKLIDEGCFVSCTFGGETLALSAALSTIRVMKRPGFFDRLWKLGKEIHQGIAEYIAELSLGDAVELKGFAPHRGLVFKEKEVLQPFDLMSVFQQTVIENGVLSLGINNVCHSMEDEDVTQAQKAIRAGLKTVRKAIDANSVEGILTGGKFTPIFRRNN